MTIATDPFRRRLLLGTVALMVAGSPSREVAAADSPGGGRAIELGILPYLPTAQLIAGHQALRRYFETSFGRAVALSTAPGFHSFQHRVLAGQYDFAIIGPGPGWQAHLDRQYQVVAVSKRLVRVFILVAKDSPIKTVAELRGKSLATIDPLTVTAQATMDILRASGLQPGADVAVRHEKTPFNAAQAVALGEVAGAGFPNVAYPNLPAEIRDRLRILHEGEGMPGVLFMARAAPDLPTPDEFQAALFRFAETPEGLAFVKEFNHDGLAKPDLKSLRTLDRFVPEIRRLMALP